MKKKLLSVWLTMAICTISAGAIANAPEATGKTTPPVLQPLPQESQAAYLSAEVLSHYHYKTMPLDNAMSEKIFDRYLKSLDGEKLFFTQADIDRISSYKLKMSDAVSKGELAAPFAIYNLYEQRANERLNYAESLLAKGFDFNVKESYQYNRSKAAWAKSDDEIRDLWRKRVKNDYLRLKLAGKDDKSIVATLTKRYDNYIARINKSKPEDTFQIFMDAYAMSIDPHTNYLGPRATEDFDISMKLSLIGIGAVLQERDDYTVIRELVPGGPAALSGKLKVGDRIVGVSQGDKSQMTDVMGWRLDDTVALIRGAADSTVLLDVIPVDAGPDGKHATIALVRKKIKLEERGAKDSVIEVKEGNATRRVGVITLPAFYQDMDARQQGEQNFTSATRDVARLVAKLKKDKIDSLLIDLRNNGGGSLNEAVELTGLFVAKGPVVQQRDANGKVTVENDTSDVALWDGPLGVLINRGSASASEIFAAAIQDYGRGVIIGESSFGKGTVQSLARLNQMIHSEKPDLGELKYTRAQFFRINGGTTQLRGVVPDISFPSFSDTEDFGEASFDNALPWSQIKPADYKAEGDLSDLVPALQARHAARVKTDRDFQNLEEDVAEAQALRKKNLLSLNEAERRKERDAAEAKTKAREKAAEAGKTAAEKQAIVEKANAMRDDGLQASERSLTSELAAEKAAKEAKDVLLIEAAHIMGDEVDLLKSDTRIASRMAPGTTVAVTTSTK
ncbi:MAG TPA: carboxy terminal-processing peptidase [Burkholderiaceae bacterium]